MSTIAIINDLHFGKGKNSEKLLESQKRFFNDQFFPYLRKNNISDVFVLGDVFDVRTGINTKIMNEAYDLFDNEFTYYIIVGNHDNFLNNSNDINSLAIFKKFSNVKIYESIKEIKLYDRKFLMVPWIFEEDKFLEDIKNYNSDIVCGHFDINSFCMGSNKVSDSNLMPEIFSKFKKVFSGHFHTKQIRMFGETEFIYCGAQYEMDWGDSDVKKGFFVLDCDTLQYEFIENTVSSKHVKITYGEDFKPSDVTNNFVKIFIKEEDTVNDKKIEEFTNKLEENSVASMSTVILKNDEELDNNIEISERGQSLFELITEFLQLQDSIDNKKEIQEILETIYTDSLKE